MKIELDLIDAIDNASEKIRDARYLAQKIEEDFFEYFAPDDSKTIIAIAYEFPRYKSLFRILSDCLFSIQTILKTAEENKKTAESELKAVSS